MKKRQTAAFILQKKWWCPERDLNSHDRFGSRDFKSLASTNSAIRASAQKNKYIETMILSKENMKIKKNQDKRSGTAGGNTFLAERISLYFFMFLQYE